MAFIYLIALLALANAAPLMAGVSKIDATLPIGVPLAGYNYPPRRHDIWPLPYVSDYTTWMTPSVGVWDPTNVRALVLDTGVEQICLVTIDAVGADGALMSMAYNFAVNDGFTVPYNNCILSASHTHSGPGAISGEFLWSFAPATDLLVSELQIQLAQSIGKAMVSAQLSLQPAKMDIGVGNLSGITHNRRAGFSPYVTSGYVDTQLGVIRVDAMDGTPLVTLWNFAIHGICFDADNLRTSADVMGAANRWIESNIGGLGMFINADAGDVNPNFGQCCQYAPNFNGGPLIGNAVSALRNTLSPSPTVEIATASNSVDFGMTSLNLTLQRLDNCTSGGQLDICTICEVLHCDANIHLPSSWVESVARFTGIRFFVNNKQTVLVTIPGEALTELGFDIRNDTALLGYDQTLLAGYSNNHMGYFATADEYDIGGYESLLTFWGIDTAAQIRAGCKSVASQVVPQVIRA